jgi:hypothetical protein
MLLLVAGMFTNPWKRFRLRRGYTRHIEELYITENTDDSKTLLRHHQLFPGHEFWSKRRGLSKTDTHEGSSNEDDAPLVGRKQGGLDLILCWNGKKELDRFDDEPSMDSSLSSVPTKDPRPWSFAASEASATPPAELSLLGQRPDEQEDQFDNEECEEDIFNEGSSPRRFRVQAWNDRFMSPVEEPLSLPRVDTPCYADALNMSTFTAETPTKAILLDEGMIPPSPLDTETGVDEDSIHFTGFEDTDDESTIGNSLHTDDSGDTEESGSTSSTEQANPFYVRSSTSPGRFRLKGSDGSCGFSLESMDSLVASYWDPDDGGSSMANPLAKVNTAATRRVSPNLNEHLGFLLAKADRSIGSTAG